METFDAPIDTRQTLPLCVQYLCAYFEDQAIQVIATDGASRELTVAWALGALRDGTWEILGAWPRSYVAPAFWQDAVDEFAARGVGERIPFIVVGAFRDARAACLDSVVLPRFCRILRRKHASDTSGAGQFGSEAACVVEKASSVRRARVALERFLPKLSADEAAVLAPDWREVLSQFDAFYALRPQLRGVVRKSAKVVEHLSRILSRAVARHGPFANPDDATSFVASTLARADQRLQFSSLVELTPPRRTAGPVGASVAAPGS